MTGVAVEDVAHEALLRAWAARASCKRPEDPWPWLKRIVHNEALRHLDVVRSDALPFEDELAVPDRRLDNVLDRAGLAAMIGTLPKSDRALLRMHYELDLSVSSLAEALDVPAGAVKVRLHRARERLRANLEQTADRG